MNFVGANVVVEIRSIVRAFEKVKHLDVKKVFQDMRGVVRFDQRHHWRKEEAPSRHWPGLAASTLERRKRPRGFNRKTGKRMSWPKKLLGRFPTALQMITNSRELIARSRVKRFSMIHQIGGVAGHGAVIPSRQYLWISPWLRDQTRRYFEKHLAKLAEKT